MLVDCYYRSRSSNVVWGYLRPQTTAAALAVPHPSPFSLLLLLPRLSRRCSCSFHVARWRGLGGRRCHCCIRIQSRSSPHCCRRPSPLPPPLWLLALLLRPRPKEGCTTTPAILLPPPSSLFALVVRSRLLEERPLSLPPPFHSPPRSPRSSSLLFALLLLILPSYDVHARAEEAALAISFCSPSRWPGSPSRRQRRRRRRHQIRAGHHRRPRRRQSPPIRPAKGWSLCVGATMANGGGGTASNSNNGRGGTRGQGRVPWSAALRSGCAVERERIIEESAQKTYPAIYPDLFPGAG